MLGGDFSGRVLRAVLAILLLGIGAAVSGCARTSYAGIPLRAGAADPELQSLAQRAKAGDKEAQLELGIRYEEGRAVPVDLQRAAKLYRLAASDSGGTQLIYVPAAGKNGRAATIPFNKGRKTLGLAAAKFRLLRLTVNAHRDGNE